MVVSGQLPTQAQEGVALAALAAQVEFQNFNPEVHAGRWFKYVLIVFVLFLYLMCMC